MKKLDLEKKFIVGCSKRREIEIEILSKILDDRMAPWRSKGLWRFNNDVFTLKKKKMTLFFEWERT